MESSNENSQRRIGFPNLKTRTMGGKQLWTDHYWQQGWRIQQNALTHHWRLIDDHNVRHAWGSRSACDNCLSLECGHEQQAPQHMVLLLHGLFRSSSSMESLANHLQQALPVQTATFEYASARASIGEHAAALRDVVAGLPATTELTFVGHSMGNIVVRHALHDWQKAGDGQTLARVRRVVMIGPPNQGSSLATQLAKVGLLQLVAGQGGSELGHEWEQFEASLATPHCPFGIIAGNAGDSRIHNPLMHEDGDLVVSVEETKLPGAADFLEVPHTHTFLMDMPVVQSAVVNFIDHQSFAD